MENYYLRKGYHVQQIVDLESLREFKSSFYGVRSEDPIVISDLSLVSGKVSYLARMVEEAKAPYVFLASQDNLPLSFLSRMMLVKKSPEIIENQSNSMEGMRGCMEKDQPIGVAQRNVVKFCPTFYPFETALLCAHVDHSDQVRELMLSAK